MPLGKSNRRPTKRKYARGPKKPVTIETFTNSFPRKLRRHIGVPISTDYQNILIKELVKGLLEDIVSIDTMLDKHGWDVETRYATTGDTMIILIYEKSSQIIQVYTCTIRKQAYPQVPKSLRSKESLEVSLLIPDSIHDIII